MAFELPPLPNFQTNIPQMPSPLDTYGKMLQLKALAGQQQLLPLEIQQKQEAVKAAQTQNQMAQLEMQSQQAMANAWKDPDFLKGFTGTPQSDSSGLGFDPDAMTKALVAKGVLPKEAMAMSGQFIERSQKLAEIYKTNAQGAEAAAALREKGLNTLGDRITDILGAPAAKAGDLLAKLKADLVHNSKAFAGVPQEDLAHVYSADLEHLPAMASLLGFDKKIVDFHKATAEAGKAQSEADLKAQEAGYQATLSKLLHGEKVSPEDLASARAYEAAQAKTTTQSDTLGVTSTNISKPAGLAAAGARGGAAAPHVNAGGGTGGGAATPGGGAPGGGGAGGIKDALVDEIGRYKADPATLSRLMVKHPDLLARVAVKYPEWDQTSYGAKNALIKSYTSGPESRSINAISTALGHAGELGEAIDALNNADGLNFLRKLGNKLGVEALGDDKVTAFNTIVHRLAPEITAAYVQGGGGEKERGANEGDFAASLGDRQLRSNLGETVKLLRSKIAAQEQQWNNTYKPTRPEDEFATRFLTPGAKQTLGKWGSGNVGASASGKTLPLAVIEKAAKDHGVSLDEAKRQAQAQGYTIQ